IQAIERLEDNRVFEQTLLLVANNDERTVVRAAAFEVLSGLENKAMYEELFAKAAGAQSYAVAGAGLNSLSAVSPERAIELARQLEPESKNELETAILKTVAFHGEEGEFSYFSSKLEQASNYDLYITAAYFSEYLKKQDLSLALNGLPLIKAAAKNGPSWAGYYFNKMIEEVSKEQIELAEDKAATEALLKKALEE
ncbi:MAG: hypothetical protein H8D62_00180, partial [Bacteroidetes bacterium]|nr:hypothetical protein [Bacteroidota bacterium]